jgi:protein-ribulosamine 3-kinase
MGKLFPTNAEYVPIGGGSINQAFKVIDDGKSYFCKVNSARDFPGLFEKEASGLNALRSTNCISTPAVLSLDYQDGKQVLLLEWIESGSKTGAFWKSFGQHLANLHAWQNAWPEEPSFGFMDDNYMGALPQQNSFMNDWCDFFREKRLEPQLHLAEQNGLLPSDTRSRFERLYEKFPQIFETVLPSLLHGDLWSGNFICNEHSEPF